MNKTEVKYQGSM